MKRLIIAAAAVLALSGCVSSEEQDRQGREAVEILGFTDVQMTGWRWTGCDGKTDTFSRGWVGTSPTGARIKGVACGGYWKGWTVRTEGRA